MVHLNLYLLINQKKKQKERDMFAFFSDGDEPEEPNEQKKMEEIESTIYQWYGGDKKKS